MKINLDDLKVYFTPLPTSIWECNGRDWENYLVVGLINKIYVGRIVVSRALNRTGDESDLFFFEGDLPKPFVAYQETDEPFRGNGICGELITAGNEGFGEILGTKLWSDTHFVHSFKEASKNVWRKLEKRGLAYDIPFIGLQDRWVMI